MRLHRLELSAFLAFPGREVVDFDDLGEAGLFLLHGRTGAGNRPWAGHRAARPAHRRTGWASASGRRRPRYRLRRA